MESSLEEQEDLFEQEQQEDLEARGETEELEKDVTPHKNKQTALFETPKKEEIFNAHLPEKEEGYFILEGILVGYKFDKNYFARTPHLEFNSDVPHLISETGYRSEFLGMGEDLMNFKSIKELVTRYCLDKTKVKPIWEISNKEELLLSQKIKKLDMKIIEKQKELITLLKQKKELKDVKG